MLEYQTSAGAAVLDQDQYYIQEEWHGWEDTLHLSLPIGHPQRADLAERLSLTDRESGQSYRITGIDEGKASADITAQLDLDELQADMLLDYDSGSGSPAVLIAAVLPPGWSVDDHSGITARRTLHLTAATPLDVIEQCTSTFDGLAVRFDTHLRRVHLYLPAGAQTSGVYFTDELNLTERPQFKGKAGDDFYTRLYARGKDGMTFSQLNGGLPYVDCHDYTDQVICRYWQDERYTDPESLLQAASEKVNAAGVPARSYECAVADLARIDPARYAYLSVQMYQVVTLVDRASKRRMDHRVARYRHWPHAPAKNIVTLSTVPGTVTGKLSAAYDAVTDTAGLTSFSQRQQAAVSAATSQITGNRGGYVVLHSSTGGKEPDEILIMDTPDIATAANVWRWNKAGLGYSGTGYNGPYSTAITQDGHIVADFVATGTLDAAQVNVVNLVASRLTSTSGSYSYDVWAAVSKLMDGDDLRVRIYTTGTEASQGLVQVFSGTHPMSGAQDESSRYSWLSPYSIGVGEDQSGAYTGTVYAGTVRAEQALYTDEVRIRDGSAQILSVADGKRTGHFERLAIDGNAAQDVRWVYSATLGGYVLTTDHTLN